MDILLLDFKRVENKVNSHVQDRLLEIGKNTASFLARILLGSFSALMAVSKGAS